MANASPDVDLNGAGSGNDTSLSYSEAAPLTAIAPQATASDADSPDLDQGSLTVAFTSGGTDDDQLRILGGDFVIDETDLYYQNLLIGSITGGSDGSSPLVVIFNADATPAIAQALIRAVGYVNFSEAPAPGDRVVTFTLDDGDGGTSTPRIATITVTPTDTPAVAKNDAIATLEDTVVSGSLFADNGSGNDSDPDGPALTITKVNNSTLNVGTVITLASGAKLIVNDDGSYSYDPNGRFTRLTDNSSGAVNITATETFTYTLAGGATATVTVTVQGVAGPGDWLMGNGADNVITGTERGDFFFDDTGGNDDFRGLGGNDVLFFGSSMTSADKADGGAGTDQLALQGDYAGRNALTLGTGVTGIESIALLAGNDARFGDTDGNFYDYDLTTLDSHVPGGGKLVVDASRLRAGEDFSFDGSAEFDGSFVIYGGNGVDDLTGGAKSDVFLFGPDGQWGAGDVVSGGGGIDQLAFRGDYDVTFGAGQLAGIENIALLSASGGPLGPFGYDLVMNDANVPAHEQMTIDAAQLRSDETLTFDGSAETDGHYRVFGGQGSDSIATGAGNDVLQGNGGADDLRGGAGADSFRYLNTLDSTNGSVDHILDFVSGSDIIDLGRIDANSLADGNQAFTWIGSIAFGNNAGELRAYQNDGTWFVEGDTNGDGVADLVIAVTTQGNAPLVQGDFFL